MNIAFAGVRHYHIITLYNAAKQHPRLNVVGAWEQDAPAAAAAKEIISEPFYDNYEQLLADPSVDIVAVGDYYGIRGKLIIRALQAGKAVIADKPLCTSLEELAEIERLSAERGLPVGCLLDLRDDAALQCAAQHIRSGVIGEIRAVHFTAQHPLNYGVRPAWYFEKGKHGGTFNDIAIHGLDAMQWLVGSGYDRTLFARQWNAYAEKEPHFADSAHFSGLLKNGAALTADVSYAAPSGAGFALPTYWRFTFWGATGFLECRAGNDHIILATSEDTVPRTVAAPPVQPIAVEGFVKECLSGVAGENTRGVLQAAKAALTLQQFADAQARL